MLWLAAAFCLLEWRVIIVAKVLQHLLLLTPFTYFVLSPERITTAHPSWHWHAVLYVFCYLYNVLETSTEHGLHLMPENVSFTSPRATTSDCEGLRDVPSVMFAAVRALYPCDCFSCCPAGLSIDLHLIPLPLGLASPLPLAPLVLALPPAPALPNPRVPELVARLLFVFVILGVIGGGGARLGVCVVVVVAFETILVDPCSTNEVSVVLHRTHLSTLSPTP